MPWKERYTISDETSIVDGDIKWPDGRRCCFRVVVDLSPACGPEGIKPADLATPDAYYGMNGGLAALVGVLDRYGIKATFAVPAVIAEIQADKLRRLADEGHEIAAHGFKHEDVSKLDKDDERTRLARTTEIIAKVTGQRPAGWFSLARPGDKFAGGAISPNTIDLLLEGGYDYFGNGLADDAPHYWVSDFAIRRAILTPVRLIAENAGVDGAVVSGKLLESKNTNWGYDAQTGEYVDMVKSGIIDPTKVVRCALQDAASVAALLITTEAMIAEKPKKDAPAMPGGGMGGMGDMDF